VKGRLITENNFVQKQIVLFEAFQNISTKVSPVWFIFGLVTPAAVEIYMTRKIISYVALSTLSY
jgi:hypothetical protein